MSDSPDEKSKPIDDLKQGLGLLFKAAKGAVDKIPTDKIEGAVRDGAKEVTKAVETVANEVDKVFVKATGGGSKSEPAPAPAAEAKKEDEKPAEPQHYDDAYAPEPPAQGPQSPGGVKGPRVG